MKNYGDGVVGFDSLEEMFGFERQNQAAALAALNEGQRKLCDGKEHFCFTLDGYPNTNLLAIIHVLSEQQILEGKYPEEAPIWFGEHGSVTRGMLPSEAWDGFYNPPGGVDENGWPVESGDPHDWHALKLMEITREEFVVMAAAECSINSLLHDPHYVSLLNEWIAQWRDRNGIPR
jgi:hypothetical protein